MINTAQLQPVTWQLQHRLFQQLLQEKCSIVSDQSNVYSSHIFFSSSPPKLLSSPFSPYRSPVGYLLSPEPLLWFRLTAAISTYNAHVAATCSPFCSTSSEINRMMLIRFLCHSITRITIHTTLPRPPDITSPLHVERSWCFVLCLILSPCKAAMLCHFKHCVWFVLFMKFCL